MDSYLTDDGQEVLVDDNGEALGFLTQAPDGATILHDGQGTVLGASDPSTGEAIDPENYQMGDTSEEDHPEYVEPDTYGESDPYAGYPPADPLDADLTWDRLGADVTRQVDGL